MDDNQCRTCLADACGSRYTIFKRVNGTAIDEMLESLTDLKVTHDDGFSKIICRKCFNDILNAYSFRTRCLDTNRTLSLALKSLEKKLQQIQRVSSEEIYAKNDSSECKPSSSHFDMIEEEVVHEDNLIEYECVDDAISSVDGDGEAEEAEIPKEDGEEEAAEYIEEYEQVEYLEDSLTDSCQCTYCEPTLAFKTDFGLKRHLYEEHQVGSNPLICFTCHIEFKVKPTVGEEVISKSIQKHMHYHEEGKTHSCTKCFEVFRTSRQLQSHENYHHNVNTKTSLLHKCKSCGAQYQTYYQLTQHIQSSLCKSHVERSFQCYICDELFNRGVTKKKHIQESHKDKAGADCPLCLRCKIPSAVAFENHYRTHFVAPRFCCSYCGRSFHESDRLQTHIRRSHDTTKLFCFWCGRDFKDKSGITRHIMGVHFNARRYKCEICSKAFTASYNLKEHRFAVHKTASKIYTCDLCCQDFLYRKKFERHRPLCSGVPERKRR